MTLRVVQLFFGLILFGITLALFVRSGLGPGPRGGLMTGFAARGHSIRNARTLIEVCVLVAGFRLGGTVGPGTALYAICIGPLAGYFIPKFARVPSMRRAPA